MRRCPHLYRFPQASQKDWCGWMRCRYKTRSHIFLHAGTHPCASFPVPRLHGMWCILTFPYQSPTVYSSNALSAPSHRFRSKAGRFWQSHHISHIHNSVIPAPIHMPHPSRSHINAPLHHSHHKTPAASETPPFPS